MHDKTVYILGAGASISAKLPTQAGLLPLVFSLKPLEMPTDVDILSLNIDSKIQRIQEFYSKFDEYRQNLGRFIVTNFATIDKSKEYNLAIEYAHMINETDSAALQVKEEHLFKAYDIAKSINVTLEDLFTIFDSVDSGREHFRLYSPKEMMEIHNELKMCIIYALSFLIATNRDENEYKEFSQMLIKKRIQTPQKEDALSIITMNWDDVLEQVLSAQCNSYNSTITKHQQHIYPDLCFYNYDLADHKNHIPSIHVKAKGHKNIKVLKMHGSLAWLECPRCNRIYTDFSNEIAAEEFSEMQCPHCKKNNILEGENPILRSLIITPTFMKSLNNLNIKNIWHNAFMDISEADKLVFIGYSFPDADFELRCMLKKAVKTTAKVTVVLSPNDNPKEYERDFMLKGIDEETINKILNKMRLPEERYKSFFGEDNVEFFYEGFSQYINKIGD